MLPANFYLKDLYQSTVQFFAFRSTELEDTEPLLLQEVRDPIARLTAQCTSLREQLESLRCCAGSRRSSSDSIHMANLSPQRDIMRLEERCKRLEKTLKDTREALRATEGELNRTRRDEVGPHPRALSERRRDVLGRPTSPFRRNTHSMINLSSLLTRSPNEPVSQHLLPADPISEERARRRSDDVFYTKVDNGWSGMQVLQAVQDLNTEILQFSATATESYSFSPASRPRQADAAQSTGTRLGKNITQLLVKRDHSQDPVLVQIALQGCAVMAITHALSSFCMGLPSKPDIMLSQIHSQMHETEPQAVSSRWRALTHRHISALQDHLQEYAVDELADTILRWAVDVFAICGCYEAGSGGSSLKARFGPQLKRISNSVTRLARVIREEILSTNFEVVAVEGGEAYDPVRMRDAFGEYVDSEGSVVATTELGVRCATFVQEEEEPERRDLLLPKVILESVVSVLN